MPIRSWTFAESIRLWDCDLSEVDPEAGLVLLSAVETEYLSHLRAAHRRRTFLASRYMIKTILAETWSVRAPDIVLERDANGKPSLRGRVETFSLSHSGNRLLFAVDFTGRELGVDIEILDPRNDLELLTRHLFNPMDLERLNALTAESRQQMILRIWCEKEARFKARIADNRASQPGFFHSGFLDAQTAFAIFVARR